MKVCRRNKQVALSMHLFCVLRPFPQGYSVGNEVSLTQSGLSSLPHSAGAKILAVWLAVLAVEPFVECIGANAHTLLFFLHAPCDLVGRPEFVELLDDPLLELGIRLYFHARTLAVGALLLCVLLCTGGTVAPCFLAVAFQLTGYGAWGNAENLRH